MIKERYIHLELDRPPLVTSRIIARVSSEPASKQGRCVMPRRVSGAPGTCINVTPMVVFSPWTVAMERCDAPRLTGSGGAVTWLCRATERWQPASYIPRQLTRISGSHPYALVRAGPLKREVSSTHGVGAETLQASDAGRTCFSSLSLSNGRIHSLCISCVSRES